MSAELEIWKTARDEYEVSNLGRLRRFLKKTKTYKILRGYKDRHGYLLVYIRRVPLRIHRLVASAFIPNPRRKAEVNHKNLIKYDNRVANLEWMTRKENNSHAIATFGTARVARGEAAGNAKLTDEDVRLIRSLHGDGFSYRDIAELYKMDHRSIGRVVRHQQWSHVKD